MIIDRSVEFSKKIGYEMLLFMSINWKIFFSGCQPLGSTMFFCGESGVPFALDEVPANKTLIKYASFYLLYYKYFL
jgi:hypothetical protein